MLEGAVIRNKDEAMAAAVLYLQRKGKDQRLVPTGAARLVDKEVLNIGPARKHEYYNLGLKDLQLEAYLETQGPGTEVFPSLEILCVRICDGVVMTHDEMLYDETLLRNEEDALKLLRWHLAENLGITVWRLVGSLQKQERLSGSYYVAQVQNGEVDARGAYRYSRELTPYFLRVEWSDVFTLEGVEAEDEEGKNDAAVDKSE